MESVMQGDNNCIHDMFPEWCAICLKLKTPEEEADIEQNRFDRWLDSLD